MTKQKTQTKRKWKDTPQAKYDKANMKQISIAFKKDFIDDFKRSCRKLYPNKPINKVMREYMESIIKKANKGA